MYISLYLYPLVIVCTSEMGAIEDANVYVPIWTGYGLISLACIWSTSQLNTYINTVKRPYIIYWMCAYILNEIHSYFHFVLGAQKGNRQRRVSRCLQLLPSVCCTFATSVVLLCTMEYFTDTQVVILVSCTVFVTWTTRSYMDSLIRTPRSTWKERLASSGIYALVCYMSYGICTLRMYYLIESLSSEGTSETVVYITLEMLLQPIVMYICALLMHFSVRIGVTEPLLRYDGDRYPARFSITSHDTANYSSSRMFNMLFDLPIRVSIFSHSLLACLALSIGMQLVDFVTILVHKWLVAKLQPTDRSYSNSGRSVYLSNMQRVIEERNSTIWMQPIIFISAALIACKVTIPVESNTLMLLISKLSAVFLSHVVGTLLLYMSTLSLHANFIYKVKVGFIELTGLIFEMLAVTYVIYASAGLAYMYNIPDIEFPIFNLT